MPRRHFRAGWVAVGRDLVNVGPADADWTYCGLRVVELNPGERGTVSTVDSECFVLPSEADTIWP